MYAESKKDSKLILNIGRTNMEWQFGEIMAGGRKPVGKS